MPRVRLTPSGRLVLRHVRGRGRDRHARILQARVAEAGVGLAPGMAFGGGAEDQIRLCYAQSRENLVQAMDRLERFIGGYRE